MHHPAFRGIVFSQYIIGIGIGKEKFSLKPGRRYDKILASIVGVYIHAIK